MWTKNHQSQPTSMTFWTACETNTEEHCLWLAHFFLLSDELSSCVWSCLLDLTSLFHEISFMRPSKGFWWQATLLKNVATIFFWFNDRRQFATATIHLYFQESDMFSRCCFRQRRCYRAAWLICDHAKVKNRQSMTACSLLHLNAMKQWH